MKLRSLCALLAAMLWLALFGQAHADEATALVTAINVERAEHMLVPLWPHESLRLSAQAHADGMAEAGVFISHTGLDGSSYITRAALFGYGPWRYLGENIAGGQASAERVLAAWLASPRHRAIVLAPRATEIGVGYATAATGPHRRYWVLEIGARSSRFGQ
jgi:uncharacterized protein YkwD